MEELQNLLFFAVILIFLVLATIQDRQERKIENEIPFSILLLSLLYSATSHSLTEAVTALIFFFSISLILYRQKAYYGGDHKVISAIGPSLAISDPIVSALGFWLIMLSAGILYFQIRKNEEKVDFMPVILFSYLITIIII